MAVSAPLRRLADILVERRLLTPDALAAAQAAEAREGVPLAAVLLRDGLVAERDLVAAIAHRAGLPFADLPDDADPNLGELVPAELMRRHHAVAVSASGDTVVVALADPADAAAVAAIAQALGRRVEPAVAVRSALARTVEAALAQRVRVVTAEALELDDLLRRLVAVGGSDLHLTAGTPPAIRRHGRLERIADHPHLDAATVERLVRACLTEDQQQAFARDLELDASYTVAGVSRFRVNAYRQRDSVGAVFRAIPFDVVPLQRLGLPPSVGRLPKLPRGLVLVTGPTGSGKSTTLAALVDVVNRTRPAHIMTVEDPIEFLHTGKVAVVNQREIGQDTHSFANALRHVLRQDPDVILVGELRDLDTVATALTAAETGHLVLATVHTQDAPQSIDRMIDVFPAHQQGQVRTQLASALQAVVTQQLVPTADGRGRVVAAEVLLATGAVRNLIREGKTFQLHATMQASAGAGMQTMDQSLAAHVAAGTVALDVALACSSHPDDLRRLCGVAV